MLCLVFLNPFFIDEIPFLWQFERGGTFLFIYFVKSYACCRLEVHVMVHGYGYLEDWLSRSSYFIGMA